MTDLDTIVKQTLANASPHTKNVYGKNPLSGQEIIDFANTKGVITLASTIRMNGRPHLSPSDLVGLDGTLFLGVDQATAHYRNLKQNPVIATIIMDGWKRQVLAEGKVKFLDVKSKLGMKIQELQKKKTGWTTDAIGELQAEKIFTWKQKS